MSAGTPLLAEMTRAIDALNLYDTITNTPLTPLHTVSQKIDATIYLKREDLQPVHSFKIRGAHAKISALTTADRHKGLITASAGNHAQGVAYSAMKQGLSATIVMPVTTPTIKVDAVKRYGAHTHLYGDSYDEAYRKARALASENGAVYIHAYDDKDVILGQGTIAKELLEASLAVDYVFIPVGGGGLLAGIAAYIKTKRPATRIIAVEPENSDCLHQALYANQRIILDQVDIFADGVAVKQIGELPFAIAKETVDATIQVSTDELCAAIKDIFDETRAIAEPSGALSLAGIKKFAKTHSLTGKTCVGILCGANINFHRLRHISERAEIGESQEALFAIKIPEKPGSFLALCTLLGQRSITEFNYRHTHHEIAQLFVGLQLSEQETSQDIMALIQHHHYTIHDLSNNDVAKLHIRYMIGGSSSLLEHERVYRFQFPERPGALLAFLTVMSAEHNITLFHYRNHGAAFGRVLAGLTVPPDQHHAFESRLTSLGYTYFDETKNVAYRTFL